jgi:hypothetical protein
MVSYNTYLLAMRQPEKVLCEEKFGRRPGRRRKQRQKKGMGALSARRIANVELLEVGLKTDRSATHGRNTIGFSATRSAGTAKRAGSAGQTKKAVFIEEYWPFEW